VEVNATAVLNVVLGRPADTSVAASVMTDAGTQVYVEFGTASGVYPGNTATETVSGAYPAVVSLTGLRANTTYVYRARYRRQGETAWRADPEASFRTQRPRGTTFTFGVQGDSHPERTKEMFNGDLYTLNMQNVRARQPDFYIALGDDFSVEPLLGKGTVSQAAVEQLYQTQRGWFSLLGASVPVFLVNGNHEDAAAYLLSPQYQTPYASLPIWAGTARNAYFALPSPDAFYTGDASTVAGVGLLRDYYAWEWGDALFVVIDPYWHSPVPVDNPVPGVSRPSDQWQSTIGDEQYAWLKRTLESSTAKFKFVFEHHVLGTGRGAAALVHQYEWGGYNKNGTAYEFRAMRPNWAMPIHQLLQANHVTVYFCGHDHLFAREKVDDVVYQEVPNPADNSYTAFNADAYDPAGISLPGARYDNSYGVVLPNAGHLSVTVAPTGVTVAYVRAVLAGDEGKAGGANGSVAHAYTIPAPAAAAPAIR